MGDRSRPTKIIERDPREVDQKQSPDTLRDDRGNRNVHHDVVGRERTVGSGDGAFRPGLEEDTRTDGTPGQGPVDFGKGATKKPRRPL